MLDPEYLRRLTEGAEQIASLLHTELVKIIVQAIVTRMERGDKYRLTARDRWMLEVLQAAGYMRGDLEREIAAKTKLMLQEMKEAFEDAGVRSLAWDDAVYIAAGLEPTPLRQSPQLIRLLERGYEKTAGEWVNFTGTTANASQQLFIRECDKAYSLVASGGMSHAQAVRQAVETVAREGVRVTYPTGHTDTVETAVARAVRTGVGQACGEMSMARMREMGWKIVLVSAHLGARTGDGGEDHTNHFWWQGKFYRLDDEDGSRTEDAAQPQQNEAEHPKTAAAQSGPAPAAAPAATRPKNFEDITGNWYPDATPGSHKVQDASEVTVDGVTYKVDGHDVQLSYSPHEKEIAELLEREVGGELYMLPRVNEPQGVKTADYLFHGKTYDLKTLEWRENSGKNRIFNPIKKAARQTENFIVDITEARLDDETVDSQIEKVFKSYETSFVEELVIIRSGKIIRVAKRRKTKD